ncbi:hypothetical protein LTS18_011984, partial [Coniosporium uncinatum]
KLSIQILHTPGHTPDSLAWYDISERHLYIGDTFYERGPDDMPIIFPKEGSWIDYMASLQKLLSFVRYYNNDSSQYSRYAGVTSWLRCFGLEGASWLDAWMGRVVQGRVSLAAGHQTSDVDAEQALEEVLVLFKRILKGEVKQQDVEMNRGEQVCFWQDPDDGAGEEARFSVKAPLRLVEEARKHFGGGEKMFEMLYGP